VFNVSLESISQILDKVFPRKYKDIKLDSAVLKEFGEGKYRLYEYNGEVKKVIHAFKLDKQKHLALVLTEDMPAEFFANYDIVIPVPCHWLRSLLRGFVHLNILFGKIPGYNNRIVKRKKYTGALFKKGRNERLKTMKNAFDINKGSLLVNKRILVVDDIYTTGTTFEEMKKELVKYKPASVEGFFLCRA